MIEHKKFEVCELPSAFALLCIIAWFALSDFCFMLRTKWLPDWFHGR